MSSIYFSGGASRLLALGRRLDKWEQTTYPYIYIYIYAPYVVEKGSCNALSACALAGYAKTEQFPRRNLRSYGFQI